MDTQKSPRFESKKQIEDRIDKAVAAFFETNVLKPKILTYDNKNDLDRVWADSSDGKHTEAPDWLVGFASYSGQIHILSPSVMPAGSEKTGQLRFSKILKHEIGHLYTSKINRHTPSWLNEGISLYLAKQDHYKKIDLNKMTVALLNELEDSPTDGRIYQIGKNMVDEIIKTGGKDLLFKIISAHSKTERNKILQKTFKWLK